MTATKISSSSGRKWFSTHHRYLLGTIAFLISTIIIEIIRAVTYKETPFLEGVSTSITSTILLSIPSIIHVFIWIKLLSKDEDNKFCNFFDFTMFLSVGSFSILHILYSSLLYFENAEGVFYWSTLVTAGMAPIVMCSMILYVNFELVEKENGLDEHSGKFHLLKNPFKTKGLKSEMFNFPFWRVLHFFAIFMSITYVFGFLIAIYDFGTDKHYLGEERGFYFEKLEAKGKIVPTSDSKDKNSNTDNAATENTATNNNSTATNQNGKNENKQEEKSKTKMPVCFYFASGDATIFPEDVKNGENSNKPFTTVDKDSKEAEIKIFVKTTNDKSMEDLLDELDEKSSKNDKVLVFELHGYADSKSIDATSKSYSSNYELSEARVIALQNVIIDKMREKNILRIKPVEWMAFPHSDKKTGTKCNEFDANMQTQEYISKFSRVVEVFVKEVDNQQITNITDIQKNLDEVNRQTVQIEKRLGEITTDAKKYTNKEPIHSERYPSILDYLYLSIGAITTNAAGDIKPVTPTARFLISIVSLFQIFFLVGFFNTLLSLQEPLPNSKDKFDGTKTLPDPTNTAISSKPPDSGG